MQCEVKMRFRFTLEFEVLPDAPAFWARRELLAVNPQLVKPAKTSSKDILRAGLTVPEFSRPKPT
jgi:hypothetical protein